MVQKSQFELPGYTLPLNYRPPVDSRDLLFGSTGMFPNALDWNDTHSQSLGKLKTYREIVMMRVMNSITDKSDWEKKVFDEEIISKWRKEIADSPQDLTPKMMDWIIKELQWKVEDFERTGLVNAFDMGVVKSDSAVSPNLQQALREVVATLENIPDEQKDYHPGSDGKVLDLVHPSLFPVVYGRSKILPDRTIGVEGCFENVAHAKVLPIPEDEEAKIPRFGGYEEDFQRGKIEGVRPYSRKFQWLPCDVRFTDDGCRIASYINNLHPHEHRDLYGVIEKVLTRTIPLWDRTLSREATDWERIKYTAAPHVNYESEPELGEDEDWMDEAYHDRLEQWRLYREVILPEPGEFQIPRVDERGIVSLQERFGETGLQVIVKLANIELTPEKPEYEGGSWHVEGQLNEHICATAIYYYDSENITPSSLSFRQRANNDMATTVSYDQDSHSFLYQVFNFDHDIQSQGSTQFTQDLGSVSCHQGRLLTFPNVLQHQVSPFSLEDRSKPGHRKILAFFLVDPHLRVISSAHVPPQREDWWTQRKEVLGEVLGERLPVELQDMVTDGVEKSPMKMDEAKAYRLELMEERRGVAQGNKERFEIGDFNLCEH